MTREPVFAALFSLLGASGYFRTVSRDFKSIAEVSASDMPALFQVEGHQTATGQTGQPRVWKYLVDLVIYVHQQSADPATTSQSQNLNLAIDAALASIASPVNRQTLGGLVSDVRVNGTVEVMDGAGGAVAVAIIPLEILANA